MALARVKTWIAGDTLTAADQNAEFNNILNNPISLVSPTTGAINFQTSVAHTNLVPTALTVSSGSTGQALVISSSGGAIWGGPSINKAWVIFSSSAGILNAFNVTSSVALTVNASGDYTLTWASAMSTANYAFSISGGNGTTASETVLYVMTCQTTTTFRLSAVRRSDGTTIAASPISVITYSV